MIFKGSSNPGHFIILWYLLYISLQVLIFWAELIHEEALDTQFHACASHDYGKFSSLIYTNFVNYFKMEIASFELSRNAWAIATLVKPLMNGMTLHRG